MEACAASRGRPGHQVVEPRRRDTETYGPKMGVVSRGRRDDPEGRDQELPPTRSVRRRGLVGRRRRDPPVPTDIIPSARGSTMRGGGVRIDPEPSPKRIDRECTLLP